MKEYYNITIGDHVVGQATAERKGLYYHFSCNCKLSGEVIYRVVVRCGDKEESLGVCIPGDEGFGLNTRLPVKRLGEGELLLQLVEELLELALACLKRRRSKLQVNPTPVTPEEARENMIEELADVSVCRRALGLDTDNRPVMLQVTRTMNEKTQRWGERLGIEEQQEDMPERYQFLNSRFSRKE